LEWEVSTNEYGAFEEREELQVVESGTPRITLYQQQVVGKAPEGKGRVEIGGRRPKDESLHLQ
jgi:hypothetical protein